MPSIELPKKLHRVLTTKARFIVVIGGRGSGKSEGVARILLLKAQTEHADVLCGREYQNSIEDSVHKLLAELIPTIGMTGAKVLEKKIDLVGGGGFRYRGFARAPESVKSAQAFKYAWIEEAQALSEKSIKDLTPTIRAKDSQLFFTANPQSEKDPFSVRFIKPFLKQLKENDGIYEDEMHLVILMNWRDNPWHDTLETERLWDYEHLPRALYDHIWEGAFNDAVENALIYAEWFDACVDAHLKLGFEPLGVKAAAHDPSDLGDDPKGFAVRHGSVIIEATLKEDGDINEGGDWATGLALQEQVDTYVWDCDGMGVGLNRQTTDAFQGKHTKVAMFKGSEKADMPEAFYNPPDKDVSLQDQKKNKEVFANKRAQYYYYLRDRVYRTYRAVLYNEYSDPDLCISFSSKIKDLAALRSELCRMPIKPNANGRFELYKKTDMKTRFKFPSPNLGDSVMMTLKPVNTVVAQPRRPEPIKAMGRGHGTQRHSRLTR